MQGLTEMLLRGMQQDTQQDNTMSLIGASLLRSPTPQFKNPWAQMGTQLANALVGSTLVGYGQSQQQQAQQAAQEAFFQSGGDPEKLRQAGLTGTANAMLMDNMMQDRAVQAKLQDPTFVYRQEQDEIANSMAQERLNLQRDQFGMQQQNAGLRGQLLQAQIAKAQADAQAVANPVLGPEAPVFDKNQFQANNEMRKQLLSHDAIKKARAVNAEIAPIREVMNDPKANDTTRDFTLNTKFIKLTQGEAINADDTNRLLKNSGLSGAVSRAVNYFNSNGTFRPDDRRSMLSAIEVLQKATNNEARRVIESEVPRMQQYAADQGLQLSPSTLKFPSLAQAVMERSEGLNNYLGEAQTPQNDQYEYRVLPDGTRQRRLKR